jgi:hypothetical protein
MTKESKVQYNQGLLWGCFCLGLIIRCLMLFHGGGSDMDKYFAWGNDALNKGLADSYHGIYFPIQYHIFTFCSFLTGVTAMPYYTVFKMVDMLFDSANFFLIIGLLKIYRCNPLYALMYWLHPWFLALFSLGYIDFQYAFFVLLIVYLLNNGASLTTYLFAGVPLGIAFLMKPQAQVLMLAAFIYSSFNLIRFKKFDSFGLLIFPTFLFVAYSLYFYIAGTNTPITHLAFHYLNVTNDYPRLSAYQINIWYIIACLIKTKGSHILTVHDDIILMFHFTVKHLAALLTISLLSVFIWKRTKLHLKKAGDNFLFILTFASTILPFAMTSAHENHYFLGSLLGIILLARSTKFKFKWAVQILLILHFLNLFGIYGEHPEFISRLMRDTYNMKVAFVYSIIASVCFIIVLVSLFNENNFPPLMVESDREDKRIIL